MAGANGSGGHPEIPVLKEKERERRGGAVPAGQGAGGSGGSGFLYKWFGIGGGRAAGTAAGSAARSGGAALVKGGVSAGAGAGMKLGLLPTVINFVSSNLGMALFTAALTGGAVYTLYTLGMRAATGAGGEQAVFASRPASAEAPAAGEPGGGVSGLSYFSTANQGGAFGEQAAPEVDAPAPEETGEPEVPEGDEVAEAQGEIAEGGAETDMVDELAKKLPKPKMLANKGFGGGNGLAGGSGLAGGFTQKFDKAELRKPSAAKPLTAPSQQTRTKLARRPVAISRAKSSRPMEQLRFSNKKSRTALGATSSEGQAFEAAEAFEAAPAIQGGQGIEGGGLGSGEAGIDPSASSDGGPIGGASTPEQTDPKDTSKEDKSPYTKALMMAMALLMTASSIITVIGIMAMIKQSNPLAMLVLTPIQKVLYGVAAAMAAAAAGIGVMIMQKYGQTTQGLIATTGGSITTAAALASIMMQQPPAWISVLGGIAGMAASVGMLLANQMGGGGMGGGGSK